MAVVQAALADDFGIQSENLAVISDKGDNSEAFSADFEGRKIIIKTVKDDQGTYPVEEASLKLLRKHGIPVATCLGYREKVKYLNQPMIVQTAVAGMSISHSPEAKKSPKVYAAIGEMLKKIHEIKLEGFGKLKVRSGQLHGKSSSWKQSLLEHNPNGVSFADTTYLVEHGFIGQAEARKIGDVFDEVLELDLPQASFLHNDVQEGHIFVDGKKITGLIDMGGVSAGDPRFDIAKTHFYLPRRFWADFDSGYRELSQDPMVAKYFLLVAARKVIYRHSNNFIHRIPEAVEILKQSLAETK